MEADLSLVNLILNASVLVQGVMALLLIVSMMSWTMIFQKARILKKARIAADEFEEKFWSGAPSSCGLTAGSTFNPCTCGTFQ